MKVSRVIEVPDVEVPQQNAVIRGSSSPTGDRQLLRQALSNPRAIRQAFLLREVLGPPVSLLSRTGDRPS